MFASDLDEDDRRAFSALLRSNYEVIAGVGHRTCGNHNTWAIASLVATAAALGDRQALHDALYGYVCPPVEGSPDTPSWRYGLIHQLRHDFLSDGMHWERTAGYHFYSLMAFTEAAMMLANIGVDVWHAELPAQMESDGYDAHRAYGPSGTKTMKAAFDAPLYLALSAGDISMLHDSGLANLRGIPIWGILYEAAFDAYRDPKYTWLLEYMERENSQRKLPGLPASLQTTTGDVDFVRLASLEYSGGAFSLAPDATISLAGMHRNGCTLLPVTGLGILRGEVNHDNAPAVQLFWGPHSAGHQNPASLHLDLSAGARMLTGTPVSDGYDDTRHATWSRTTIAHNTVSIDERRMFPYDVATDSIWEADSWRGRESDGVLQLFQPDNDFKAIRAFNQNVYPGTRLDRTVVVTGRYVLDAFRVISDEEHQCDWAWHGSGRLEPAELGEPVEVGHGAGYGHLANARLLQPTETWPELTWNDGRGRTTGHIVPPAGAQLIVADTPAPDVGHPALGEGFVSRERSTLLVRTRAAHAVFIALWSFDGDRPSVAAVRGEADKAIEVTVREGGSATRWYLPFQSGPVRCGTKPAHNL
jgi:hypothetical protein